MNLSNLFGKNTNANNNKFVIRGTLLEMIKYAQDNNLKMNQVPVHLIGGYFAPTSNLQFSPVIY
tara:strand:- start:232 stop:423 length:192 start_codon:yes stop_codon:yes gene_type:complete